jgi:serine protease Do/serine protease DegQ
VANGGAAQAGIKAGDVVVSIDGKKVTQKSELLEKIASRNKDEVVKVLVNRNGSDREFQVRLN